MNTPSSSDLPQVPSSPCGRIVRIIACVLLAVGALFLLGSAWSYSNSQEKLNTWMRTTGTIVELVHNSGGSDGSSTYCPRFTFVSDDGHQHSVTSTTGSNPPAFQVGQEVEVLYSPEKPAEAEINSFLELYFLCCALGFFGLVDVLLGGVLLVAARRRK